MQYNIISHKGKQADEEDPIDEEPMLFKEKTDFNEAGYKQFCYIEGKLVEMGFKRNKVIYLL